MGFNVSLLLVDTEISSRVREFLIFAVKNFGFCNSENSNFFEARPRINTHYPHFASVAFWTTSALQEFRKLLTLNDAANRRLTCNQ